jgi:hypothetical protein
MVMALGLCVKWPLTLRVGIGAFLSKGGLHRNQMMILLVPLLQLKGLFESVLSIRLTYIHIVPWQIRIKINEFL